MRLRLYFPAHRRRFTFTFLTVCPVSVTIDGFACCRVVGQLVGHGRLKLKSYRTCSRLGGHGAAQLVTVSSFHSCAFEHKRLCGLKRRLAFIREERLRGCSCVTSTEEIVFEPRTVWVEIFVKRCISFCHILPTISHLITHLCFLFVKAKSIIPPYKVALIISPSSNLGGVCLAHFLLLHFPTCSLM